MDSIKILPQNKNLLFLFIIAILFILLFRLGALPLKFEEPRRALVATEMMISGNYVAPTINGEFYYNKPPLFNWILAGLFETLGQKEWVERLPTVLSIISLSLINFLFFRRRIGTEVAALSSLFFVLAGHMLFYFSFQGEIDMTYTFVVYCQILSIIYFFEKRKYFPLFIISYLLMTIGFMMKGLPSIAFQGLTLAGLFVWEKRFWKLFHLGHVIAVFIAGALFTSYFFLYSQHNDPELLISRLTVESARRTTDSGGFGTFIIQLIKFPLLLLMLMLPWSLLIIGIRDIKSAWTNKWIKYSLLFLLFNLPLYWISEGARDRYLYMFLPFLLNVLVFLSYLFFVKYTRTISWFAAAFIVLLSVVFIVLPFVQPVPILYSVIAILILAILGIASYSNKIHPVFSLMLMMILLRFYYNEVVFPLRIADPKNIEAYAPAFRIIEIVGDSEVKFLSDKISSEAKLPFRESVVIEEIERLPYQLSYYYSSRTNKILKWVGTEPDSGYFIQIGQGDTRSVYDFEMEGREFSLIKK
jgi:4-amino-4-deoxy-L-arabinose transferase-like glycosyltransferase